VATFKAIVITKTENGTAAALTDFDEQDLMEGDVTLRPEWSTVNYKDGLAITGKAPVVRRFPMIAGVDAAATVEASSHPAWKPGDQVLLNGWGCGETHLGMFAQKARVKGDWLIALPPGHRLAGRQKLALQALQGESLIVMKSGHGFRKIVLDALVRAGVEMRVVYESEEIETVQALVEAGLGVSLVPRMVQRGAGPVYLELTFRTLFRTSEAILEEPPVERGGNYIQTMSCAVTHCCSTPFSFIPTSCKLRGPFPTLWGEPQGFGLPAG